MVSGFAGGVSSAAPAQPLVRTAVAASLFAELERQGGGGGVGDQAGRGWAAPQDGWP